MTFRKPLDPRPRNEDGATLAFVALLLFVFLGVAALAVDLGRLMGARTQAQRTADAAAMAGAAAFPLGLEDEDATTGLAKDWAVDYGAANEVMGDGPVIRRDEDVDVIYNEAKVRVRVLRTSAYGGPISNIFATALGFGASNVAADAAAQAFPAGKATCPLPWVLVDRWYSESVSPPRLTTQWDDDDDDQPPFDPAVDYYERGGATLPYVPYNPTSWGAQDKGTVFRIKPGNPHEAPHPSWYYPVVVGTGPGGNEYRNAIANCDRSVSIEIGDVLDVEPGNMPGPTGQGVDGRDGLVAKDPTAYWDEGQNCLMHTADALPDGTPIQRDPTTGCTTSGSPRVRPLVVLDPAEAPTDHGRTTVTVRNFAAVFVICAGESSPPYQSCSGGGGNQQNVWLRYVQMTGEAGGNLPPDPNSPIQFVQLVE